MPAAIGPYSPYVLAGDLVVTSGQLGVVQGDDGAPRLVDATATGQLAQALRNGTALIEQAGLSTRNVIKATLFLTDMADFADCNAVWIEHFGEHRPARTAIGVAALPFGARVEVELWASSAVA